jgi:hypothetical protein
MRSKIPLYVASLYFLGESLLSFQAGLYSAVEAGGIWALVALIFVFPWGLFNLNFLAHCLPHSLMQGQYGATALIECGTLLNAGIIYAFMIYVVSPIKASNRNQ